MSGGRGREKKRVIKASEIGQYRFCSVAWFLQNLGHKPEGYEILTGMAKHAETGRVIEKTERMRSTYRLLLWAGLLLILLGLIGVAVWLA